MEICPAFIDETGILSGLRREQPVYGIGVLVIPDTRAITNSLYRLHYKPDRSSVFIEDVLCSVPTVKGCLRATSDMAVYLQIVDVLLGCVQFDWKDANGYYGTTSQRAKEKRELVDFVKSRLGLPSGERMLTKATSSQRWETPSLFTVRLGSW